MAADAVAVEQGPVEEGEPVLVSQEGPVAVVSLNRPHTLNAVTAAMAAAYATAMRAADADPAVRAIVLTGAGRGFCSGADLSLLDQGADSIRGFLPTGGDGPELGLKRRKPVIAAVNGPVAGLGFAYLLGCDIRFAARGASMSTTFAPLLARFDGGDQGPGVRGPGPFPGAGTCSGDGHDGRVLRPARSCRGARCPPGRTST